MPRSRADGLPHAPLVPELDLPRLEPGTARDLRPGAHLDLTEARPRRVAMARSRIGLLRVRRAGLTDVDLRETALGEVDDATGLRGASVSPDRPVLPAPAHVVGLRVLRP